MLDINSSPHRTRVSVSISSIISFSWQIKWKYSLCKDLVRYREFSIRQHVFLVWHIYYITLPVAPQCVSCKYSIIFYTKLVSSSLSIKLFMNVKNLQCMTGTLHNTENYCIYAPVAQGYLAVMYLSVYLCFINYLSVTISCLSITCLYVCLSSICPISVLTLLIVIKTKTTHMITGSKNHTCIHLHP